MSVWLNQRRPPAPCWVQVEEVNVGSGYGEEAVAGEGGVRFTIDPATAPSLDDMALSKVFMRYQGEKTHFAFLAGAEGIGLSDTAHHAVELLKHCFSVVAVLRGDEYVVRASDGFVPGVGVGDVVDVGEVNVPKSRVLTR
jgi:hypothetical protein